MFCASERIVCIPSVSRAAVGVRVAQHVARKLNHHHLLFGHIIGRNPLAVDEVEHRLHAVIDARQGQARLFIYAIRSNACMQSSFLVKAEKRT